MFGFGSADPVADYFGQQAGTTLAPANQTEPLAYLQAMLADANPNNQYLPTEWTDPNSKTRKIIRYWIAINYMPPGNPNNLPDAANRVWSQDPTVIQTLSQAANALAIHYYDTNGQLITTNLDSNAIGSYLVVPTDMLLTVMSLNLGTLPGALLQTSWFYTPIDYYMTANQVLIAIAQDYQTVNKYASDRQIQLAPTPQFLLTKPRPTIPGGTPVVTTNLSAATQAALNAANKNASIVGSLLFQAAPADKTSGGTYNISTGLPITSAPIIKTGVPTKPWTTNEKIAAGGAAAALLAMLFFL